MELEAVGVDIKGPENHSVLRHLRNDRIQPISEEELSARRRAIDLDCLFMPDRSWIGYGCHHSESGLSEGRAKRRALAFYVELWIA